MNSKSFVPSKFRRSPMVVGLALGAVVSLALVGCSANSAPPANPSPGESAPVAEGLFDQSLQDLLPEAIKKAGVISFGGLWETPPVLSVDLADPTKPAGIAPETAALFGEVLGMDIEWQNLAWPAQLPGLQSGSVDVLFGQVSITAEREQSIVDLIPWEARAQGMLVAAGNPKNIDSISGMCGLTMAVPIGSTQAADVTAISDTECVGKNKPAIELAEYQGGAAAIAALRADGVDAWTDVLANVNATAASDPKAFAAVPVPKEEMPIEFSGIAVAKDNPGLTKALAGALKILIEGGQFAAIHEGFGIENQLTADEVVINPMTNTPVGKMAD